jgi:hypothetical protein
MRRATEGGWNNNAAYNGVSLPDNADDSLSQNLPWHKGGYHDHYTQIVEQSLDELEDRARLEGWSPEQAYTQLRLLTASLDEELTGWSRYKVE